MKTIFFLILMLIPCFVMALTPTTSTPPDLTLQGMLLQHLNTILGGLSTAVIAWFIRWLEKRKMKAKHRKQLNIIENDLNVFKNELAKRDPSNSTILS